MNPKLTPGNKLSPAQIAQVKRAFVYRLTTENGYPQRNPTGARVPAITDEQWINEHAFYFRKDGQLASRPAHCEPAFMVEEN